MKGYTLDVAGLTDRGVKRDHNEDAWAAPASDLTAAQTASKGLLYVVADGVGGHQAGDVASAMAVEIIQQHYYADPSPDVAASLTDAIQASDEAISQEAASKSERYGMGSTVTAVVLRDDELTVANVGDSRTYLIREGQTYQLTTDHTWVEEQVRIGLITREEAAKHPQRNIITRSLGGSQQLRVDIFEKHMLPGDSVLLCSDGLSNLVSAPEISDVVGQSNKAATVVHTLVELAKQRGAPDNVTAVLLNLKRERSGLGRPLLAVAIIAGVILILGSLALLLLDTDQGDVKPVLPLPTLAPTAQATLPPPTPQPDTPTPTALPPTPTATLLPLDAAIPPPALLQPPDDTPVVAGTNFLFTWEWEGELLQGENWRFVLEILTERAITPIVREELPLNQRGYGLSQALEPGVYRWTLAVVGSNRRGEPAERQLVVVEPTATAAGSN